MSIWHTPDLSDGETVNISEDSLSLDILIDNDNSGNVYVSLGIQQLRAFLFPEAEKEIEYWRQKTRKLSDSMRHFRCPAMSKLDDILQDPRPARKDSDLFPGMS